TKPLSRGDVPETERRREPVGGGNERLAVGREAEVAGGPVEAAHPPTCRHVEEPGHLAGDGEVAAVGGEGELLGRVQPAVVAEAGEGPLRQGVVGGCGLLRRAGRAPGGLRLTGGGEGQPKEEGGGQCRPVHGHVSLGAKAGMWGIYPQPTAERGG